MCEDNGYEPLAEVFIKLDDDSDDEDIYCLCSRVVISGCQPDDDDLIEESCDNITTEENVSHYFSSSKESFQPLPLLNFRKKENEEAVSCYCSASHCSTDEHDSIRETGGGPHSDSGADLSESCSRDLEWERYWSANGEAIVWTSWVTKYGNYIDPTYQQRNIDSSDDDCDVVKGTSDRRNTFEGLLSAINEETEPHSITIEDIQDSAQLTARKEELQLAELVDLAGGDSSTGGSWCTDDLSEDYFRLRSASRSSGRTSLVTDSLTNVTPITISELSEESSGANSFVSSSESVNSNDLQWQQIWLEHFNEQYHRCYEIFMAKYEIAAEVTPPTASEIFSDSVFTEEVGSKVEEEDEEEEKERQNYFKLHGQQGLTDQLVSVLEDKEEEEEEEEEDLEANQREENKENIEYSQSQLVRKQKKRGGNKNKYINYVRETQSVGYLLYSLRSLCMDQSQESDRIRQDVSEDVQLELREAERKNSSGMIYVPATFSENMEKFTANTDDIDMKFRQNRELIKTNLTPSDEQPSDVINSACDSPCEVSSKRYMYHGDDPGSRSTASSDVITVVNSEECHATTEKKQLKRSHDKDDPSLDRVKGAFTLMGFVFKPPPSQQMDSVKAGSSSCKFKSRVTRAHIVYRKKNIRSHNRTLNMKPNQPRHIRFGDDGLPIGEALKPTESVSSSDSPMVSTVPLIPNLSTTAASASINTTASTLHQDEYFSEKDDDSTDGTDIDMSPLSSSPRTRFSFPNEEETVNTQLNSSFGSLGGDRAAQRKCRRKQRSKKLRKYALPKEIQENNNLMKYWYRRFSLFSKFDDGIRLDYESWYSVTPEKVSKHTADRCRCDLIIDACCGAGGNTIQFAFTCERVIAIDIDPAKIELARHNAQIYGVEDRIEFIVGDFLSLASKFVADVVFLSPPWGGPEYLSEQEYNLDRIQVHGGGEALFRAALGISSNICYYLPKNINTDQLLKLAAPGGSVEVEQNFLDKKLVAVTAYFGELVESL